MITDVIIIDGSRQPNIDESIYSGWSVIADLGSTMEIKATKRPEIVEKENEALKVSSQFIIAKEILNDTLPVERISEFAKVFDEPRAGQVYKKDWILRDPLTDELFAVIKEQVTFQAHWKMADIASEFKPFRNDAVVNAWVQPLSTNPYPLGAKVTHRGSTWESMHPANVWEPGGAGIGQNIWKKI